MTRAAAAVAPFEFQTATRMVFGRDALERVPALVRELATLEGVDVEKNPVFIVAGESTLFSERLERLLREGGVGGGELDPGALEGGRSEEGEPGGETLERGLALGLFVGDFGDV